MGDSKAVILTRRARERAIARGDGDLVARQERALRRALREQESYARRPRWPT